LLPKLVPPHTDAMGHTNVVFIDESGSMTAASDPRSDGAAVVGSCSKPRGSALAARRGGE
jgi:gamma-glutamyltranspeptidase/glutathione hydrolase